MHTHNHHEPSIQGDSIYVIHDGTERDKTVMERLVSHLERRTHKQLHLISAREATGIELIRHFHLRGTHFVLIVRKDKALHHVWADGDMFDATYIAYIAEQAH